MWTSDRRLHQIRSVDWIRDISTRLLSHRYVTGTTFHQYPLIKLASRYIASYSLAWLDYSEPYIYWNRGVVYQQKGPWLHISMDCCAWSENYDRQEYKQLFFEMFKGDCQATAFCFSWTKDGRLLRYTDNLADMKPWQQKLLTDALRAFHDHSDELEWSI